MYRQSPAENRPRSERRAEAATARRMWRGSAQDADDDASGKAPEPQSAMGRRGAAPTTSALPSPKGIRTKADSLALVVERRSEVDTKVCVEPIAIVVTAEIPVGGPREDVDAKPDRRVLLHVPVEAWPDHSARVLEVLDPEDLRLEGSGQLGRHEQARPEPIAADYEVP